MMAEDRLVVEQEAPRQHSQKCVRFPEEENDKHRDQDVEGTDIAKRCLAFNPIPTRRTSWRLSQRGSGRGDSGFSVVLGCTPVLMRPPPHRH